jgi:hypothetical protein
MNNPILHKIIPSLKARNYLRKNLTFIRRLLNFYLIIVAKRKQHKAISRLKQKEKLKVAFFMVTPASWKCHSLYDEMTENAAFEPVVIVIPFVKVGKEEMHQLMRTAQEFCVRQNYKYISTWDNQEQKFMDIKEVVNPDIIFFSHPYPISYKDYSLPNHLDSLNCWVPYSVRQESLYKDMFDQLYHNMFWRNYCESDIHYNISKKYARNKGSNVIVTGHPVIDAIVSAKTDNGSWIPQKKAKKRIVWAPHWTIKGYASSPLNWATFLRYCDLMLELAVEYEDQIQFAFKPHPLLQSTLEKDNLWGKNKTANYFTKWRTLSNAQIHEEYYLDLFADSDALIHDCGSFMIEYLALNKPVLYVQNEYEVNYRFNEYGIQALNCHYKAFNEIDVRNFINNLINEKDALKPVRAEFVKKWFMLDGETAATHIVNDLLSSLGKN